jgi:hypothetical protein
MGNVISKLERKKMELEKMEKEKMEWNFSYTITIIIMVDI